MKGVRGRERGWLLLHPSEEGIVVLVDPATTARVRMTVVLLVGEVVIVHVDILVVAVVAVAVAHARLLRSDSRATGQRAALVKVEELGW